MCPLSVRSRCVSVYLLGWPGIGSSLSSADRWTYIHQSTIPFPFYPICFRPPLYSQLTHHHNKPAICSKFNQFPTYLHLVLWYTHLPHLFYTNQIWAVRSVALLPVWIWIGMKIRNFDCKFLESQSVVWTVECILCSCTQPFKFTVAFLSTLHYCIAFIFMSNLNVKLKNVFFLWFDILQYVQYI